MIFNVKNIISLNEVESTNNYAMQLVSDKAGEGTVVLAQFQSRGRGQAGSYWESEAGKNLLMSLVLKPVFLEAGKQFFLSMTVSLALADVLKIYTGDVSIKWPNDIYIGNKKIAGILIENSLKGAMLERSTVGIGLNINQEKFESNAPNPVSLKQLTLKEHSVKQVLDELLNAVDNWYRRLKEGDYTQIKQAYLSALYRHNGWNLYRDTNGDFEAQIAGIGEFGQLKLEERSGKIRSYLFKEVEFVL